MSAIYNVPMGAIYTHPDVEGYLTSEQLGQIQCGKWVNDLKKWCFATSIKHKISCMASIIIKIVKLVIDFFVFMLSIPFIIANALIDVWLDLV